MLSKRLAGMLAVSAVVALAGAMPAQAQVMVPMQPQPLWVQPPPDRVEFYSDMPKAEPGDNPALWSPRQNVIESQRYERLIRTNRAFRAARIRKECGGYADPEAFQQCEATFY